MSYRRESHGRRSDERTVEESEATALRDGRGLSEAAKGRANVSGVIGSAVVAGILYTLCR